MCLALVGQKYDTAVGNMAGNYATKRKVSIATHDLMNKRDFIVVMGFPRLVQQQGSASWNINIICHNFSFHCCVCLPSILYFTC